MKIARAPIEDDILQLVTILKKIQPEKIILFGSTTKGEVDEWSDLDIIVIKKSDDPFLKRLRNAPSLFQVSRACDLLIYTPEEFLKLAKTHSPFIENVLKEGRVIYEA